MSFWDFNPWDKYDVIEEKHLHLLTGALRDSETNIDQLDHSTFILYGKQEALLLQTKNKILKWTLQLYSAFVNSSICK
jgi:hypothetical protein